MGQMSSPLHVNLVYIVYRDSFQYCPVKKLNWSRKLTADLGGASTSLSDSWTGVPQQNSMPLGLVRCTAPITNSFIQFAELKLTTVHRCNSANCTSEFLIGAVHRTAPITVLTDIHILLCYTSKSRWNQSMIFVNSVTYWHLRNTLAWVALNFMQGPDILRCMQ